MPAKIFVFNGSPPGRTALIAAEAVDLDYDLHVFKTVEELRTPEMLKINPQHTLPFLNDDGNIISDSHAIAVYLVEKYGKNRSLYPEDAHQRAVVNQRMFYDSSVMFNTVLDVLAGFTKKQFKTIPNEKLQPMKDIYETLEKYLAEKRWIAGDNVTIADFCCGTTTLSLDIMCPIDKKTYPKVNDWLNRVKNLTYFKKDPERYDLFKNYVYNLSNWN